MLSSFWSMVQAVILGQIRTGLAGLGGILVAKGLLTADHTNDFIGAVFFLVSAAFSAFDKFVVQKKVAKAARSGSVRQ